MISHAYKHEKEIYGKRHGEDELCSENPQNYQRSISTVLVLGPVLSQTDQSVAGSGCDLRRNYRSEYYQGQHGTVVVLVSVMSQTDQPETVAGCDLLRTYRS